MSAHGRIYVLGLLSKGTEQLLSCLVASLVILSVPRPKP